MNRLLVVGLGSNLGDRKDQVSTAIRKVEEQVGRLLAISRMYESEPMGVNHAQPYINAVAVYSTPLGPASVHEKLKAIELKMGRTGKGDLLPRTIDLDLICLGEEVLHTADLIIPHLRMHLRKFVLQPLADVVPGWRHPAFQSTSLQLLAQCNDTGWVCVAG